MVIQVVSASRRTDIPAFYAEWLLNRLRAGYCLTSNPFNPRQVTRVALAPGETVLVLWTRDPRPLLPALPELEGFRHYFLFTLTAYPRHLEPGLPPLGQLVASFSRLSRLIGPRRVIWRYDPIILSRELDAAYHLQAFTALARALEGATERVVVSFLDPYPRVMRRLKVNRDPPDPDLLGRLAGIAGEHGIRLQTCAEGLEPEGKCVDDGLVSELSGVAVPARKDPGQRPACRCVASRDIGAYDTCLHGCLYCYATRGRAARRNLARHDPRAPWLLAPPD
ncbi:MAG: DUF1848 domain-containing protein [bacterium]|nr:DUF1848 domain-containing protein [bacterium]